MSITPCILWRQATSQIIYFPEWI